MFFRNFQIAMHLFYNEFGAQRTHLMAAHHLAQDFILS